VNQESLRELLARVHERLSANSSVDNESRQLLGTLMRDIERALGGGATAVVQPQAVAQAAAHVSRLEGLAVDFQAGHPQLAELLRQLIDALGKAGI
jgi:predicted component of type VI protein secretion system